MHFYPERLQQVRAALMITKAEAARRLNISAMAYGRYEKGEREPSYQSVCYIAQTFHCNPDYLYGISNEMNADYIMISRSENPELYSLLLDLQENPELYSLLLDLQENKDMKERILAYFRTCCLRES